MDDSGVPTFMEITIYPAQLVIPSCSASVASDAKRTALRAALCAMKRWLLQCAAPKRDVRWSKKHE
jgi:hypothetical protein